MSIEIKGTIYYYSGEALKKVGITRMTFYRWVKENKVADVALRDRNQRRLFSEEDIQRLQDYYYQTSIIE